MQFTPPLPRQGIKCAKCGSDDVGVRDAGYIVFNREYKQKDTDVERPSDGQAKQDRGSTDFKQCGWCRHANGVHWHNCCLEGVCNARIPGSRAVVWPDDCFFLTASSEDLVAIVGHHQREAAHHEGLMREHIAIGVAVEVGI